MDDAALVGGRERDGEVPRDWRHFLERHRPFRDPVGEGRTVDEFEHQCRRRRLTVLVELFESVDCAMNG